VNAKRGSENRFLARLLEAQLAAAEAGDDEATRALHEAIGKLLGR